MKFMRTLCAFALLFASALPAQGPRRKLELPQILDRLGQQALAFGKIAPTTIAEETLEQRTRKPTPDAIDFDTHEVVSAYGFAGLKDAPAALHEVRKVISVDGKQVTTLAKARQTLTLGLQSADDKLKKKLLEDFEKHGLRGAVTDFGQIILLFSPRHLKEYEFQIAGDREIGADSCILLTYKQTTGSSGVTIFRGNAMERDPLRGEVFVRKSDALPLRIGLTIVTKNGVVKDESTVDYAESPFGSLLPVSVVHREYVKDDLMSENVFRYGTFRKLEGDESMKLPGN